MINHCSSLDTSRVQGVSVVRPPHKHAKKSPFSTMVIPKAKAKPITMVGIVVLIPNATITTVAMGLGASLGTTRVQGVSAKRGHPHQQIHIWPHGNTKNQSKAHYDGWYCCIDPQYNNNNHRNGAGCQSLYHTSPRSVDEKRASPPTNPHLAPWQHQKQKQGPL